MNLKRRDSAAPGPEGRDVPKRPDGKKPVLVYILVLFIVALLLMFWSLLSHQRNNTEAIGALSDSVAAMKDAQITQERASELQERLTEAEAENTDLKKQLAELQGQVRDAQEHEETLRQSDDALYYLYALQLQYLDGDYKACRATIKAMEDGGLAKVLPDGGGAIDVTCPALRYQQLKEAVEAQPAGE